MAAVEWVVTGTSVPTVFATVQTDHWQITAETTNAATDLVVLQHSLLILTCVAAYPVIWKPWNEDVETNTSYCVNSKINSFNTSNSYEIPVIERYEANLTFENFSQSMTGDYSCGQINDPRFFPRLTLKLKTKESTINCAEVIQSGFYWIWPQPGFFFRSWKTKLSIPFIWEIPLNLTVTYALWRRKGAYPGKDVEWALPQPQLGKSSKVNIEDYMEVKQKLLSPRVGQTIITITRGSYFNVAKYSFILRTHGTMGGVVEKRKSFGMSLDNVLGGALENVETLSMFDSSTMLPLHRKFDVRLYYSNPDWTNARVIVQEQEYNSTGCIPKKVEAAESCDVCGLVSASFFNEFESGIRLVINVTRACIFTILFDSPKQATTVSLSLYVVALDTKVFGYLSEGTKLIVEPELQNNTAYTNDSITLKCLMPKCHSFYIGWNGGAYGLGFPPFQFDNNDTGAYPTTNPFRNPFHPDDTITVSFSEYNQHTVSNDIIFSQVRKVWMGKELGDSIFVCDTYPASSRKRHDIYDPPAASRFRLNVIDPITPTFSDGQNFDNVVKMLKRGSSLPLLCQVHGLPKPVIVWNSMVNSQEGNIHNEDGTLLVTESGTYTCNASNKYGWNIRRYQVQYSTDIPIALAIPIAVTAFVLLLSLGFLAWWIRKRNIKAAFRELAKSLETSTAFIPIDDSAFLNDQVQFLQYNRDLEIERDRFTISKSLLGVGEFGYVYKGELKLDKHGATKEVAIKLPKASYNLQEFRSLADELKIMSHIRRHVNVLVLVGACTQNARNGELFVLTEFCENGSLKDYLEKNRMKYEGFEVNACGQFLGALGSIEALLKYAYQAANGMAYLAAEKIIHRDLALRNLLLTRSHIVKIADFGMSRQSINHPIYKKWHSPNVAIPVFWMAIESLQCGHYTKASDVWSFGIVLWEMFSCGRTPYPDHEADVYFWRWLKENDNNRMGPPTIASDDMYQLMRSCWNSDADARPSFSECKRIVSRTLEQRSPSMYQSMIVSLSNAWLTFAPNSSTSSNDTSAFPEVETDATPLLQSESGQGQEEDSTMMGAIYENSAMSITEWNEERVPAPYSCLH